MKFIVSQQVERMKTKDVSQRVEVDVTPPSIVGLVSVEILADVTPGGDHVADLDAEQVEEKVKLFAVIRIKLNLRK